VQATWETHYGALCRGVSWSRFSLPQLLEISECIGGVGLSVVFRLMAEDHAGSSGATCSRHGSNRTALATPENGACMSAQDVDARLMFELACCSCRCLISTLISTLSSQSAT
jgi:hypothetical protein